jgi:hypothetical protein
MGIFGRLAVLAAIACTVISGCSTEPLPTGSVAIGDISFAKGGGGGGTVVTATVTSMSPGLLPSPDDSYTVTIPSGGGLEIRPACSSSDRLDLQGMGAAFDALGVRSTCNGNAGAGFMFLKLHANTLSAVGQPCADQDAPQPTSNGANFGPTSRYFFVVDGSDADSKFDDKGYTLVLTDCEVLAVAGDPLARRVTATRGDLYDGQTTSPMSGFTDLSVNVDITFRP